MDAARQSIHEPALHGPALDARAPVEPAAAAAAPIEQAPEPAAAPSTLPGTAPACRPALEVRGLRKAYADTVAVDDLSFTVEEGEIFGFIGPNGAGKTTTIRMLATLLEPSAGQAWIDGVSVQDDPEEVRRRMGYLPDSFGVYEGITVQEYLDFFAAAFRLGRARRRAVVRDVMELTDLAGLAQRMVSSLSRGMKQRLCLAKTLVHDPRVLLLDEPASALDPRARIELRELLKELRGMGKTILISSHILTELADLCTSVGIIEKGRLVYRGGIEAVRQQRAGRVVLRLHREEPAAGELLRHHPHVSEVETRGREVSFLYGGDPGEFHAVLKLLTDRQVPLLEVSQQSGSLESLFLEVTRGHVQ